VIGRPVSSNNFGKAMHGPLASEISQNLRKRSRKERKEDPGDPKGLASEALAVFDGSPSHNTLTIWYATLVRGGRADGLTVGALRVPIEAVTAWWIAGERKVKAPSSSGVVVGGLVPVRN
jgi:hypothetical protein